MDFLPSDLKNVICNYKYQFELLEKYNNVMSELKSVEKEHHEENNFISRWWSSFYISSDDILNIHNIMCLGRCDEILKVDNDLYMVITL